MRILFAADVSPITEGSGAERVLQEHARRLARRGHDVRILHRHEAPGPVDEAWDGCRLFPYRASRGGAGRFVGSTLLHGRRALHRALTGWAPDVIDLHQPYTGLPMLTSWPGRRPPLVYTFHSPSPAEYVRQPAVREALDGGGVRAWWHRYARQPVIRRVEGAVVGRADGILVLSDYMAEQLRRWHPRTRTIPVRVIPGGVDTERFRPAADRTTVRREWSVGHDTRLLVTVRNLEARTGVGELVAAAAQLARRRRGFALLMAGDGPLRSRLERRIRELDLTGSVRLLGFVSEDRLPGLYQAADLYVQPDTELQGFGLPVVEALACGTPVLATPVGGARETLDGLGEEFLLEGTDAGAMARGIESFLARPDLLGQRARYRDFAVEGFDWERVVDLLEDYLAEVTRR